ncbi:MAG: response regulator [Myxococcales bacterium FL481]|nr:MAG: response regulator [Myxococcales bacterium FL481]
MRWAARPPLASRAPGRVGTAGGMTSPRPAILCVDDEEDVLDGIENGVRRFFTVHCATDPVQALRRLEHETFAVIVSDMRMPGMMGAEFLARARKLAPTAVRVLLTGQTDLTTAVAAINDGQIFRFLVKPCPTEQLIRCLRAAYRQYELVRVEQTLLEETLRGSVDALVDVWSIVAPRHYAHAQSVRRVVAAANRARGRTTGWTLEVASLLHDLGALAAPPELALRLVQGDTDDDDLATWREQSNALTRRVLERIPRLDALVSLLEQSWNPDPLTDDDSEAHLLFWARVLVQRVSTGTPFRDAMAELARRGASRPWMDALQDAGVEALWPRSQTQAVSSHALECGMVFARDVVTTQGVLLACGGTPVSEMLLARLHSCAPGVLPETIDVAWPATPPSDPTESDRTPPADRER